MPRNKLTICCLVTLVVLILLVVTLVILYFTVFKLKPPVVLVTPVSLRSVEIGLQPPNPSLNVTLGIDILIRNRNYAGFEYRNTTAFVSYRGTTVGEAPMPPGTVAARSTETVPTTVEVIVSKLLVDLSLWLELVATGKLELSSSTKMDGKVILAGIMKLHATTSTTCSVTVKVNEKSTDSSCATSIDF